MESIRDKVFSFAEQHSHMVVAYAILITAVLVVMFVLYYRREGLAPSRRRGASKASADSIEDELDSLIASINEKQRAAVEKA